MIDDQKTDKIISLYCEYCKTVPIAHPCYKITVDISEYGGIQCDENCKPNCFDGPLPAEREYNNLVEIGQMTF